MKTEPVKRVVPISILHVSAHRMSQISSMYAYLVFSSRLQPKLHKTVLSSSFEGMIMSDCIFSSIIYWRRKRNICTVVFKPVGNSPAVIFHFSADNGNISSVEDCLMPVMLQQLLRLHILGIYHQPTGVTVKSMNHMCRTTLMSPFKIIIKDSFDIQGLMSCSHRQNTWLFIYHDNPLVFVYDVNITALERIVLFGTADRDLHSWLKRIVKLGYLLSIHSNTMSLERSLYLASGCRQC